MVRYKTNPLVRALAPPPIAEVQGWVRNRSDSIRGPLLDVSQAVPSYTPARGLLDHLVERLDDPGTALYTDISGLPAMVGLGRRYQRRLAEPVVLPGQ